jgi:asparagine synthase (glutamine-hydrolysing)
MKLRGFSKKFLLKQSQRSRLPEWLLDRPKQGFNAPVSQWILGPLRELCEDVLFSGPMDDWFDGPQVRRLWTEHRTMQRDHGLKLFGLLTVALFLRGAYPLREAGGRDRFPDDDAGCHAMRRPSPQARPAIGS